MFISLTILTVAFFTIIVIAGYFGSIFFNAMILWRGLAFSIEPFTAHLTEMYHEVREYVVRGYIKMFGAMAIPLLYCFVVMFSTTGAVGSWS